MWPPLDHLNLVAELVAAHRVLVAAAAEVGDRAAGRRRRRRCGGGRGRRGIDGLRDALVVGGPDHIDAGGGDRPTDHHHRELSVQGGQALGRSLRTEQDQGLAPGVEQRLDRPRLVAAAGDGAQDQVVAVPLGGLVDVLDELGVEGVADVQHDADQSAASAGQHARRPVRAVAQAGGRSQHALPGGGARSGDATEHHRHRRRGDADLGGDVLQARTPRRLSRGQSDHPASLDTSSGRAHTLTR